VAGCRYCKKIWFQEGKKRERGLLFFNMKWTEKQGGEKGVNAVKSFLA